MKTVEEEMKYRPNVFHMHRFPEEPFSKKRIFRWYELIFSSNYIQI